MDLILTRPHETAGDYWDKRLVATSPASGQNWLAVKPTSDAGALDDSGWGALVIAEFCVAAGQRIGDRLPVDDLDGRWVTTLARLTWAGTRGLRGRRHFAVGVASRRDRPAPVGADKSVFASHAPSRTRLNLFLAGRTQRHAI
jgi:hypothetical protein